MKEKKVTCLFIPDGQVALQAKIDRRGFCEGEYINVSAKFENTCSRIVIPKAAIIAKHMYQANGRTKVWRQKLSSVRGNHIISGMCDAWEGKSIRVPKIRPSILGCDIIRVEYTLMVSSYSVPSKKLLTAVWRSSIYFLTRLDFRFLSLTLPLCFCSSDLRPHPWQ